MMKSIVKFVSILAIIVSLNGCIWPGYYHHGGGGYHHDEGRYHRQDGPGWRHY
ncbi:hypothetical protein [Rouxiella aceris]|jgi:hypothetical protein|uniref:hypothetical protein n=1 Tax=Rouxiella aceris TaxID=2703884 RepID=UPI00146BF4E8|nr:hypothetical protein [Rouxiella aceris]